MTKAPDKLTAAIETFNSFSDEQIIKGMIDNPEACLMVVQIMKKALKAYNEVYAAYVEVYSMIEKAS